MRFLLDSHCWLWLVSEPENILPATLDQLSRADAELFFSAASGWEIAIKFASGKLQLAEPPESFIPSRLRRDRIVELPVELPHVLRAAALPPHHKDPFDRLLVAQAQLLGLRLVTRDGWVPSYEVDWLQA